MIGTAAYQHSTTGLPWWV